MQQNLQKAADHQELLKIMNVLRQEASYKQLSNVIAGQIQESLSEQVIVHFKELRQQIDKRPLYIMFEERLNCDIQHDHEVPKSVLPIFDSYLASHEVALLADMSTISAQLVQEHVERAFNDMFRLIDDQEYRINLLMSCGDSNIVTTNCQQKQIDELIRAHADDRMQLNGKIMQQQEQLISKNRNEKFKADFNQQGLGVSGGDSLTTQLEQLRKNSEARIAVALTQLKDKEKAYKDLQKQYQELLEKLQKQSSQIVELTEANSQIPDLMEKLKDRNATLAMAREHITELEHDASKVKPDQPRMSATEIELREKVVRQSETIETLCEQLKVKNEGYYALDAKVTELQNHLSRANANLKHFQELSSDQASTAIDGSSGLKQQLIAQQLKITELEDQNDALQTIIEQHNAEQSKESKKKEDKEREKLAKLKEMERLAQQKREMMSPKFPNQKSELEEKTEQADQLAAQNAQLSQQIMILQQQLSKSSSQANLYRQQQQDLQNRMDDLMQKLFGVNARGTLEEILSKIDQVKTGKLIVDHEIVENDIELVDTAISPTETKTQVDALMREVIDLKSKLQDAQKQLKKDVIVDMTKNEIIISDNTLENVVDQQVALANLQNGIDQGEAKIQSLEEAYKYIYDQLQFESIGIQVGGDYQEDQFYQDGSLSYPGSVEYQNELGKQLNGQKPFGQNGQNGQGLGGQGQNGKSSNINTKPYKPGNILPGQQVEIEELDLRNTHISESDMNMAQSGRFRQIGDSVVDSLYGEQLIDSVDLPSDLRNGKQGKSMVVAEGKYLEKSAVANLDTKRPVSKATESEYAYNQEVFRRSNDGRDRSRLKAMQDFIEIQQKAFGKVSKLSVLDAYQQENQRFGSQQLSQDDLIYLQEQQLRLSAAVHNVNRRLAFDMRITYAGDPNEVLRQIEFKRQHVINAIQQQRDILNQYKRQSVLKTLQQATDMTTCNASLVIISEEQKRNYSLVNKQLVRTSGSQLGRSSTQQASRLPVLTSQQKASLIDLGFSENNPMRITTNQGSAGFQRVNTVTHVVNFGRKSFKQ